MSPAEQIKDIDLDISYCKNTLENYNQLLVYGDTAYSNVSYEDFKEFPYLILDENEFVDSLHESAVGYQYKREIEFNKRTNKWEYVS